MDSTGYIIRQVPIQVFCWPDALFSDFRTKRCLWVVESLHFSRCQIGALEFWAITSHCCPRALIKPLGGTSYAPRACAGHYLGLASGVWSPRSLAQYFHSFKLGQALGELLVYCDSESEARGPGESGFG